MIVFIEAMLHVGWFCVCKQLALHWQSSIKN
jgi:hypothetical protein